jgi:hypothetical protein
VRKIEGQKTLLGRTMHAIFYDALHDEIIVPQEIAQAILTFRGGASGEEPPIRVIQGPLTQMHQPDKLDVDPVHNEIFVAQKDPINKVLVFRRDAHGNVAPIRILRASSGVRFEENVAVDPVNNVLLVSGAVVTGGRRETRLLVYNRTDEGTTAPKATIGGPGSQYTGGSMVVYPPKGWVVATSAWQGGSGGARASLARYDQYIGVWSIHDNGAVAPRWRLGGPNGTFLQIRNLALDAKNRSVIAADKRLNAVMTFSFPEMFQ